MRGNSRNIVPYLWFVDALRVAGIQRDGIALPQLAIQTHQHRASEAPALTKPRFGTGMA